MSTSPVTVIGPDKKTYKFPAGTTKDKAVAYFKKKGIGVQTAPPATAAKPPITEPVARRSSVPGSPDGLLKPFVPPDPKFDNSKHIGSMALEGVKELGQSVYAVGKDLVKNPNWVFGHESVYQHVIDDPAKKEALEANAAMKLHQYDRAGIHEIAGMLPIVGPWVGETYERANTSGDPWGSLAKFESQMFAGETVGKALDKVPSKAEVVKSMRQKAGKLEVQASHTEIPEKALDKAEMAKAGQAMAEAKVIGTKLTLPRKLDQLVKEKMKTVDQSVAQANTAGRTADVTQALDTAVDTAKQRAAALGDRKALDALDRWKLMQSADLDPKTKQWTPRNLKAVDAKTLLNHTRLLEHDAGWEGGKTPEAIQNAAKIYRKALNDHLDTVAPGTAKLRGQESQLIKNREGAKANADSAFLETKAKMKSYFQSPGTLVAFAALKGLGFSWLGAIAPVVGLKTVWDSTLSRTTRAAALQWASDILEGKRQSTVAQVGSPPAVPSPGPTPPAPGGQPAPTSNFQQSNQILLDIAKSVLEPNAPIAQVVVTAQKIKAVKALQAAVGAPAAQTAPNVGEAPTGQPNAANPLQGNTLQLPPAPGPQITKVAEGVSGIGPKAKALLDRLDDLTQRKPKSGKDKQDIEREISEIKKAADSGTSAEERSAIKKRITDREHIARKRAAAAAESPGASSTAPRELSATGGNPEHQTMLIEQGLAKLKTYGELGKATAAGIAHDAKARKWSAAEEMAQIAEAIEFLKAQSTLPSEDVK
jgi:hypothetical protein